MGRTVAKVGRGYGHRTGWTYSVSSDPARAIKEAARKAIDNKWDDVELAMSAAVDDAVAYMKDNMYGRGGLARWDDDNNGLHMIEAVAGKIKRGSRQLSAEIGWPNTHKQYYDWQERGTRGRRIAGAGGKRYYDTGKKKAGGATPGNRGIPAMNLIPETAIVFRQAFQKYIRELS